MKAGDAILCPIYSIAHLLKPIEGDLLYELIENRGQYFLKYLVDEKDSEQTYEKMFWKFRAACVGLSVVTVGHFWVQDVLLNEEFENLWKREKTIPLVPHKEIEPNNPLPLTGFHYSVGEDITYWIANNYPRVFNYYSTGQFLLRASLPVEYLYADVLLNFFKIIELITYKRTRKKPNLEVILCDAKTLKIFSVDESDIRQFYKLRCSDAAHDHDKVRGISRRQAVECNMWVDELIVKDLMSRSEKPKQRIEIKESLNGAVIRPICDETKQGQTTHD